MKRIMTMAAIAALGTAGSAIAQGSHTPIGNELPDAQTGECFARVVIPAVYDDVPQTVTKQAAYDRLSVTEPQFAPDTVTIQTRDEGIRYIVRQPRYETRTEEVLAKPAYERLTVIPAQFETVTETVQVGEPRLVWRPGKHLSGITRTDNTGAVYCLVEEPGKTVTVNKRVVRVPEQISAVSVPAQYVTVTKQVLVDPGGVDQQVIPAEFSDVPVSRLIQPAGQVSQPVAPLTDTINTRVLRTPERFEWAPVLCNTNANQSSIARVQSALTDAGYYTGPIDGIAGPGTQTALRSFQSAQGLPIHGNITARTAQALGISDVVSGTRQAASSAHAPTHRRIAAHQPIHNSDQGDVWSPPVQQQHSAVPHHQPAHPTHAAVQSHSNTATDYARAAPAVPATPSAVPATAAAPTASAPALRQRRRLNWAGKKP